MSRQQGPDRVVDLTQHRTRVPGEVLTRVPVAWVQGTLALDVSPQVEPPRPPARLRSASDVAALAHDERVALDSFAATWVTAAVQIAMADRPVTQMLRHCTPQVYADLSQRSKAVRDTLGTGRARVVRPVVLSVHTSLVRDDALEVSAHVRHGHRSRAVAARLEHIRGRWQGVAVSFG